MNISILCSDPAHPVVPHLEKWIQAHSAEHTINLAHKKDSLDHGDVLFLVSCNEIIESAIKDKFGYALVLHASDLPKGRGWSPYIWDVLSGANEVHVCLIAASDPVDTGVIYLKDTFTLDGSELLAEIHEKLFAIEIELMTQFISSTNDIDFHYQSGSATYYQKRSPEDSKLNPYKTIAEQFNQLRVVDNDRFPAYFELNGNKYILKIEKDITE